MAVHLNGTRLQGQQFRGERTSARFHCEYGPMHRIRNRTSRCDASLAKMAHGPTDSSTNLGLVLSFRHSSEGDE